MYYVAIFIHGADKMKRYFFKFDLALPITFKQRCQHQRMDQQHRTLAPLKVWAPKTTKSQKQATESRHRATLKYNNISSGGTSL